MQTLLVTVIGPRRTCDLELPGEITIQVLLPFLLEICGPQNTSLPEQGTTDWCLSLASGTTALNHSRSLFDAGVLDGAILHLQKTASLMEVKAPQTHFTPRVVKAGPGTGGIGVKWNKDGLLP
jgi:hypothetical protein